MANPLLETKLYVPRWRHGLVPRPRLKERLNRGAETKLTLVSAPAGFGKTTLLAEWLTAAPADKRSAAWLSLDQRESHAALFWSYLIAALQTVEPGVGASGDLESAHRTYAAGMQSVQRAGHISDVISGTSVLADIRMAQGRLHEAMRTYEQALQLATAQGEPVPRGTADLYVGLSELHREHGDLHAATQHLLRSQELRERTGFPPNRTRWCVAMARIREAQGDLDGALALLDEAERMYVPDFFPNVRPVAALKARVWAKHGRVGEAVGWARARGLSAGDDLSYLRVRAHNSGQAAAGTA